MLMQFKLHITLKSEDKGELNEPQKREHRVVIIINNDCANITSSSHVLRYTMTCADVTIPGIAEDGIHVQL